MTIANMTTEAGAHGAVMRLTRRWSTTSDVIRGPPKAQVWDAACAAWRALQIDCGAVFARVVTIDVSTVAPMVTWGTSPDQAAAITDFVPDPSSETDLARARAASNALSYMGLRPGTKLDVIPIIHAFIGSRTNARIESLRNAARVVGGRRIAPGVRGMIVPRSTAVREQADAEGLANIFRSVGFEWRQSGCSMCLAMNDDALASGDRCASSTNRNFEGRQCAGARTHLMSPAMTAAAAVRGRITDVRTLTGEA